MTFQTSASAANLNSPAKPEAKIHGQFTAQFWNDRFFFVSYSNNSEHSYSAYSHCRRDQENEPQVNPLPSV